MVYAALFCLEYKVKPGDIQMELRLYQNDEVIFHNPEADEIVPIIDKIIASLQVDALINDTIKGSILLVAVIIQLVVPMIRSRIKTKHTSEV